MMTNYQKKDENDGLALACLAECIVIGVGHFHPGDRITDSTVIDRLRGNPNFQEVKEDK